jgi:hypothetical protein
LAVCARNLHDYARMQDLLTRYQRDQGPSMSADDKEDVANALAAVRPLVGTVKLSVNQEGALVQADGQRIGTTPLADPIVLNLGKHTLSVTKEGFQPTEQTVDIGGGSETSLAVTLVGRTTLGHLVVSADAAATIGVDGKQAEKGRFDGPVPAGVHEVVVTEAGMLPYKAQVELAAGETRSLEVTLEREGHGAPIWPWIVAGAAVAAGAAVGGYFLFQPQDQVTPVPQGQYGTFQLMSRRH